MAGLTRRQLLKAGAGACIGVSIFTRVQGQPIPLPLTPHLQPPADTGTDLASFPKITKDSTGIVLTRDETRVLLTFRTPQNPSSIKPDLAGTGVMIESGAVKVNHTPTRFWVRSTSGTPITQIIINRLETKLGLRLEWIGPVYQKPQPDVPIPEAALVCPLPRVLIIKPQANVTDIALQTALRAYSLEEVPARSKDLMRTKYFALTSGGNIKSVYGLVDRILQANAQLVKEVRFSNMPLLNPSAACSVGIPTDTYYINGKQWNMHGIRAGNGNGLPGWNICTGDPLVVIAVIDRDGCDLIHPDLLQNYFNSGKTWDGNNTYPNASNSGNHGTQCAGIAAASHNGFGIAGVTSVCKILPLRPANSTDDEVESAIGYAADNGAHIISMSFGWYLQADDSSVSGINDALDYAFNTKKVVICAATLNNGLSNIAYPANHPVVIACGASNYADTRCAIGDFPPGNDGSNYGPELSVVAPGSLLPPDMNNNRAGIPTTLPGGGYAPAFWGTSAATAQVAGLAGLLMSYWPQLRLNPNPVREIIERTADKVPTSGSYNQTKSHGAWWNEMGYGRINLYRALTEGEQYINTSDTTPPCAPTNLRVN